MNKRFNILFLSAGRRVALMGTFREALERLGLEGEILAADMSRCSSAYHSADRAWQVPRCTDPQYIDMLLKICREAHVGLVIPTIDTELKVLSENRDSFLEVGTQVMISSPETIEITHDKWSTHRWLTREGFPTVQQETPERVLAHPEDWSFPLLIKPVSGSASIGVAVVSTPAELVAGTADGDYIVQTLAQGEEYTVSVFINADGECLEAVPRKRLEVRAGEVSKGITVRAEPVEALAKSVIERLPGAYGALNIQIFWDAQSQELNVIEVNPRFGGGYPLAWESGAPYSAWLIQESLGMPCMKASPWRDGVVMLRFDEAVFVTSEDIADGGEPSA